jgi:hypothetical protein
MVNIALVNTTFVTYISLISSGIAIVRDDYFFVDIRDLSTATSRHDQHQSRGKHS